MSRVAVSEQLDLAGPQYDEAQGMVVFYGAGPNTAHLYESGALPALMSEREVHFFEVAKPQIPVSPDRLHRTDTEAGRMSAANLMRSGGVHAVYLSVPPRAHLPLIRDSLRLAGQGLINRLVVPKPVVTSSQEARQVTLALRAAKQERARQGISSQWNGQEKSLLYVHEHYQRKECWTALREKLGEVTGRLGRLRSVIVDIEEPITVEQEGRLVAFEGGALEDLGPHAMSLALDVAYAINRETNRYDISSRVQSWVERFRYEGSELPSDVETGFIAHVATQITDHELGNQRHGVECTLMGGKGLGQRKEAVLVFVDPATGEESTIAVDLKRNKLYVPLACAELFPKTEFTDNGYGRVVLAGLNGGDPDISFQHWNQARIVTSWGAELARQARQSELLIHPQGMSLSELEDLRKLPSALH